LSTAPVDQQADVKMGDASAYLENIKTYLGKSRPPESIMQDFGRLENALADRAKIRREADEKIARSFVSTALVTAARIAKELKKLPRFENLLKDARESNNTGSIARWERIITEIDGNISTDMTTYYDTLSSVVTLNKEIVDSAFSWRNAYLNDPSRKVAAAWQLQVIDPVKAHFSQFFNDKKGNIDTWRNDFFQVKGVIAED